MEKSSINGGLSIAMITKTPMASPAASRHFQDTSQKP
jgi:hypothetical protein